MTGEATAEVTSEDLADVASTLFFIVGPSRSGTTLLQAMLNAHPRICIPPETHFFAYEAEFDEGLSRIAGAGDLDAFARFLFREKRRMGDLGLEHAQVLAEVQRLGLEDSKRDFFLLILALYQARVGKDIVGEKTPRHLLHVETLARRYPQARFLALFRDPRAKALSERKVPFGSPSLFVATRRWRRYAREHQRLRRALDAERYHPTSYEALVRHPRRETEALASFLDVAFEENMLHFHEREARGYPAREDWKAKTRKPLQVKHIDKWKEELSNREVALVERTAGRYLREMGYTPVAEGISRGALALTCTWARDYLRAVRKHMEEWKS